MNVEEIKALVRKICNGIFKYFLNLDFKGFLKKLRNGEINILLDVQTADTFVTKTEKMITYLQNSKIMKANELKGWDDMFTN